MQVFVRSDHHITGSESVTERVQTIVEGAVGRFRDRITRVEVHLNDVNSHKHGPDDKRCLMEARVGGLKPIAVSHQAPTLLAALETAADKLARALESTLGRLDETQGRRPRKDEVAGIDSLERAGSRSAD